VAERDQRRRLDLEGDAEQLLHLPVAEAVDGRQAAADAERARRQHEVLHGRVDRGAGRQRRRHAVGRDAGEDQHRRLGQVLGQVPRGGDHLPDRAVGRRRGGVPVVRELQQLAPRLAVQLAQARARRGVADHDEAPALAVAAARRADRRVQDPAEHGVGDRVGREAPDGSLRGDDLEEVHGPSVDRSRRGHYHTPRGPGGDPP